MPNLVNIRKLVVVLESGLFPQTKSWLHTDEGFCCLGVASELCRQDNPEIYHWARNINGHFEFVTPLGNSLGSLPVATAEWLGLEPTTPIRLGSQVLQKPIMPSDLDLVGPDGKELRASQMNDDGKSFAEIAAAIRRTFPEAFQ